MPGTPIARARRKQLDDMGEEKVFALYVELGSVHKVLKTLFQPMRGGEGIECGRRDFYRWLHAEPTRWARWEEAQQDRGHVEADLVSEVADNVDADNVGVSRIKLDVHKWRAERLNRAAYGPPTQNINVGIGVQVGQSWLDALKSVPHETLGPNTAQLSPSLIDSLSPTNQQQSAVDVDSIQPSTPDDRRNT